MKGRACNSLNISIGEDWKGEKEQVNGYSRYERRAQVDMKSGKVWSCGEM